MAKDPAYKEAVDIIGLHYPSDYSDYTTCHSLDKPFWASEESSSYDDINGGTHFLHLYPQIAPAFLK